MMHPAAARVTRIERSRLLGGTSKTNGQHGESHPRATCINKNRDKFKFWFFQFAPKSLDWGHLSPACHVCFVILRVCL
jgi:hypothetical protein